MEKPTINKSLPTQLNYIAPLGQVGYGVAGLNILRALCKLDTKVSLFPIGQSPRVDCVVQSLQNAKTFSYHAPCVKMWHQFDLATHVGQGPYTAFPIFELDNFTDAEIHHLYYPDNIAVCSKWAKNIVIEKVKRKNVFVVPLGVDPSIFYPRKFDVNKPYTFINIGKWEIRKGHDVLLDVFNKAFTEKDNVRLILMPHNPFLSREDQDAWVKLYKESPLGNKIDILHPVNSHEHVARLISQADCGIFLSRAEGWNLSLLEVMSMNKPVIATDYSGHTEFCTSENTSLIDINKLEDAYDGIWFSNQGQWAELGNQQIEQTIEYMKKMYKDRPENPDGVQTGKKYTWANSAKTLLENI